jgi:hypothetical protein
LSIITTKPQNEQGLWEGGVIPLGKIQRGFLIEVSFCSLRRKVSSGPGSKQGMVQEMGQLAFHGQLWERGFMAS